MPELPEVQTTVNGLREHIIGLTIADAWSDYGSPYFIGSDTIKDPAYFKRLRTDILEMKVTGVERRAKNILIGLAKKGGAASTLLIHMKMTGHLLYGTYRFDPSRKKDPWQPISPPALKDPFNRNVHFVLSFTNGMHLALSDVRKFAKVSLIASEHPHLSDHLIDIGPEPLDTDFTLERFAARLYARGGVKIKQVLLDQTVIAGIGNIYADESLWRAGIHPMERVSDIGMKDMKALFDAVKKTLSRGINFGGDSTSDYRNVLGEKGSFHERHRAYRKTGERCSKKECPGTIIRISLGGRGTHFCDTHQPLIGQTPAGRPSKQKAPRLRPPRR